MKDLTNIEALLDQGRYLEARHIAGTLHANTPSLHVSRLYALALSKSGIPDEAVSILESLQREFPDDVETAGILGGVYKELFRKNQQTNFAAKSRDTYLKNFQATNSYYTGINAAAMCAMLMQGPKSREIAMQVASLINPATENFWELATLAEAHFLLKDAVATDYYVKARKSGGTDWGKIGSVFNQLTLLNNYVPVKKELLKLYHPPGIVAFVGHMIDHPSRSDPRFPASIEIDIKNALKSALITINAHIGYCSVACGGDILFAEAMEELGREVNLFIPFAVRDFIETSVRFAGAHWIERFNRLVEKFPPTVLVTEGYGGLDELFDHQIQVIFGTAILRSKRQENKTTLLTVLSETDLRRKVGGTSSSLDHWPNDDHLNINPDAFLKKNESIKPPHSGALPVVTARDLNLKVFSFVIFDTSHIPSFQREQILKKLRTEETDGILPVNMGPELVAYAFESEIVALDLLANYLNVSNMKGLMHWGIGHLDNDLSRSPALQTMLQLNKVVPVGIYLTEEVAATLTLNQKKYSVVYSGPVLLPDADKISLFNLRPAR